MNKKQLYYYYDSSSSIITSDAWRLLFKASPTKYRIIVSVDLPFIRAKE